MLNKAYIGSPTCTREPVRLIIVKEPGSHGQISGSALRFVARFRLTTNCWTESMMAAKKKINSDFERELNQSSDQVLLLRTVTFLEPPKLLRARSNSYYRGV